MFSERLTESTALPSHHHRAPGLATVDTSGQAGAWAAAMAATPKNNPLQSKRSFVEENDFIFFIVSYHFEVFLKSKPKPM